MPAQQVAEFLLKRASAMVFLLRLYILQHGIELARAYRKRAISALPQEPAITSINCFDSLRRYFLDLFDQLGLGKCSRQRRDDVNVISNTADAHKFSTKVTADCRQISVHARLHVVIEPRLAILRAKDDVKDDFTERLGHGANDDPTARRSESRFQRLFIAIEFLGRCARLK